MGSCGPRLEVVKKKARQGQRLVFVVYDCLCFQSSPMLSGYFHICNDFMSERRRHSRCWDEREDEVLVESTYKCKNCIC